MRPSRKAEPSVRELVRRQLLARGCPGDVATRLAGEVECEGEGEHFLLGHPHHGRSGFDPSDRDSVAAAASALVDYVVDTNAELVDRTQRREPGCEPLWDLPDR